MTKSTYWHWARLVVSWKDCSSAVHQIFGTHSLSGMPEVSRGTWRLWCTKITRAGCISKYAIISPEDPSSTSLPHLDNTIPSAREDNRRFQWMPCACDSRAFIMCLILLKNPAAITKGGKKVFLRYPVSCAGHKSSQCRRRVLIENVSEIRYSLVSLPFPKP